MIKKRAPLREKYFQRVLKLYYTERLSYRQITKVIPVGKTTVFNWITNFAKDNPQKVLAMEEQSLQSGPQFTQESQKDLPENIKELQAEISRLQKELHKEKIRAEAYDMMITLAEKAFKIPIRKKSGAER